MCNAVSEIYSLYTDSKDLFKGNCTKLPEVLIEANNVLQTAGNSKFKFAKNVKNGYDFFAKSGFEKCAKYTDINLDAVALVDGVVNSCISNKGKSTKHKLLSITSFLSGFGAKLAIEGIMNSKSGANILQKTSSIVSSFVTKPLSFLSKNPEKVKNVATYIISGLAFQIISDKVTETVESFAEKYITHNGEETK